jgi:hypothetical protein
VLLSRLEAIVPEKNISCQFVCLVGFSPAARETHKTRQKGKECGLKLSKFGRLRPEQLLILSDSLISRWETFSQEGIAEMEPRLRILLDF